MATVADSTSVDATTENNAPGQMKSWPQWSCSPNLVLFPDLVFLKNKQKKTTATFDCSKINNNALIKNWRCRSQDKATLNHKSKTSHHISLLTQVSCTGVTERWAVSYMHVNVELVH